MTTDRERWLRLSSLFDRAIDLDAAGRRGLLDTECADDPALREELQRMLDADTADSAFDAGAHHVITRHGDDEDDGDDPSFDDDRLGIWRLEGQLGRGGMGTVHAAYRDDDTAQRAAIKRLRRRWDGSAQAQRFLQERRILAALSHSNIPRLLDHGLDADGRPWFALEHVDGQPLTTAADTRKLGLRERIVLMLQICDAVKHAHEHFVVHRDLKPSNILVDGDGHAKVLDFGVAKRIDDDEGQTRTGMAAGFTPEYAAPEQITGGTISAATDVHALGVLLYELLAGRLPHTFDSHDLRAAAEAISTGQAPRLEQAITTGSNADVSARLQARRTDVRAFRRYVRGDLGRILQTALAKEPQRRYASVQAFADDLRRFLDGRPVSVSGDTFGYRTRKFVQRNRWGVAMAAVAAITLAAGVTGIAVKSSEARREAERATAEAARANNERERANREVERLSAVNSFLGSIFAGAGPTRAGSTQLSLVDALDNATRVAEADYADHPQLQIRVLQAASESYSALGNSEHAVTLLRHALQVQESKLPDAREDRALLLSSLAYELANSEPANALRWAQEAVALQKAADPDNLHGMMAALSGLVAVQYANGDPQGALATTREGITLMERARLGIDNANYQGALSSLALTLGGLGRFDEADRIHERLIAERLKLDGAETRAVALERSYHARTLLLAGRFDKALEEVDRAIPLLSRDLGDGHIETISARMRRGIALSGLGRHADALPLLQAAHEYGRTHHFERRQAYAGHVYARALATLGRCDDARAVVDELRRRSLDPRDEGRLPTDGSPCKP